MITIPDPWLVSLFNKYLLVMTFNFLSRRLLYFDENSNGKRKDNLQFASYSWASSSSWYDRCFHYWHLLHTHREEHSKRQARRSRMEMEVKISSLLSSIGLNWSIDWITLLIDASLSKASESSESWVFSPTIVLLTCSLNCVSHVLCVSWFAVVVVSVIHDILSPFVSSEMEAFACNFICCQWLPSLSHLLRITTRI